MRGPIDERLLSECCQAAQLDRPFGHSYENPAEQFLPAAGPSAVQLADMLPKMLALQQPLVTRSTLDALTALCSSSASNLGVKHSARVLTLMLDADSTWESRESNVLISAMQLIETCLLR